MSLKEKSLSILTPMYGWTGTGNHFDSIIELVIALNQLKIPWSRTTTGNESLISRARNRLADEYLKNSTHSHALFVDADIGFDTRDVLAMLESDCDIIGAPCPKKSIRWDRVQAAIKKNGREFTNEELARLAGDFVFNFEPFQGQKQFKMEELQEMRHLGTGLLMIRRNVFEKFREAYPDRWYNGYGDSSALPGPIHDFFQVGVNPETHDYDSEDYRFCLDCKAIGFKVMMMPSVRTTHMGTYKFIGDLPAVAATVGHL
jgi:hypothetical protein